METPENKIVITGASGFIGRHLLEDLAGTPHKIKVITRDLSKEFPFLPAGAEVVKADLRDYDSLLAAFEHADLIIHTAAEIRDPSQLELTNVVGTANLVGAAKAQKVKRIIHLSSVGVVGSGFSAVSKKVTEHTVCDPKNDYEKTKLASENFLLAAAEEGFFDLIVLRPTNVYGEYHAKDVMLAPFLHMLQRKPLPYTRNAQVNYLYVKDLTKLMIRLIADAEIRGIFNVGESMPVRSFYHYMEQELGVKARWIRIPLFLIKFMELMGGRKLRPLTNAVVYDDSELRKFYQYHYGAAEGLKRTIAYYRSKGKLK